MIFGVLCGPEYNWKEKKEAAKEQKDEVQIPDMEKNW